MGMPDRGRSAPEWGKNVRPTCVGTHSGTSRHRGTPGAQRSLKGGRVKKILSAMLVLVALEVTVGLGACFTGGRGTFSLELPVVLPALFVIEPGVSVVGDLEDEVFYSDGYYWARQEDTWYRTRDHRRGWTHVERERVPTVIVSAPHGRYRRYHPAGPDHHGPKHERER